MTLDLFEGADHGTPQLEEKSSVDKVFQFLDDYLK
jgi:hypothetical protein